MRSVVLNYFVFFAVFFILLGAGCAKKSAPTLDQVFLNNRAEFSEMAGHFERQGTLQGVSSITYPSEKKTCDFINKWQHCSDMNEWSTFESGTGDGKFRYVSSAEQVLTEENVDRVLYQSTMTLLSRYGLAGVFRVGSGPDFSVQFVDNANNRLVHWPTVQDKKLDSTTEQSGELFGVQSLGENWYVYRPLK